jgi:hypothetical protein
MKSLWIDWGSVVVMRISLLREYRSVRGFCQQGGE